MKAIMISIKPKWCADIMNGKKTIEVRKNKALATAIQKLIDENGYADIYVYCSKDKKSKVFGFADRYSVDFITSDRHRDTGLSGYVIFKFRCCKMEEIKFTEYQWIGTKETPSLQVLDKSCLSVEEITTYLKSKNGYGYAIHISDLEIFDMPKELSKFKVRRGDCPFPCFICNVRYCQLKKAPQNFCYVEI